MIRSIAKRLRLFRRSEDGSVMLIEFCIFVPILFGTFLMSMEMGIYSMRQMYLDRGLDIAVRHVRLTTNVNHTHDDIKDMICMNVGWLENCNETLRLEMVTVNPRQFSQFSQTADCVDVSATPQPPRGFTLGLENQMMMLRACVRFDPIFPTTGLGKEMIEGEDSNQAKMISTAAFVQEPG